LAEHDSEKFYRLSRGTYHGRGGRDSRYPLAAATAAAVIVSLCHATAAAAVVVTAIAVTEEKNENDEKAPVVIATHNLTSLF
jgi:hypothetical protein